MKTAILINVQRGVLGLNTPNVHNLVASVLSLENASVSSPKIPKNVTAKVFKLKNATLTLAQHWVSGVNSRTAQPHVEAVYKKEHVSANLDRTVMVKLFNLSHVMICHVLFGHLGQNSLLARNPAGQEVKLGQDYVKEE